MQNYLIYQNIFAPFRFMGSLWPFVVVLFFFSVIMHEVAHGYAALKCGDDTAMLMGRLTLNPVPHIDPLGTILLPLLMIIARTGIVFGWAKPVPINPYNFHNLKDGMIKVSISGVLTNFSIAALLAALVYIFNMLGLHNTSTGSGLIIVLTSTASVNIVLGIFNLIPVPPLDGSNLLSALLPPHLSDKYERIKPYGFFIIVFLLFTGIIWYVIALFGNLFFRLLFMGLPL